MSYDPNSLHTNQENSFSLPRIAANIMQKLGKLSFLGGSHNVGDQGSTPAVPQPALANVYQQPAYEHRDPVFSDRPGIYTETGMTVLEEPPLEEIESLRKADKRIRYIPFHEKSLRFGPNSKDTVAPDPAAPAGSGRYILSDDEEYMSSIVNNYGIGGNTFAGYVEPYLCMDIMGIMKAKGMRSVMVRGIACSLGETIEEVSETDNVSTRILSAIEIVNAGTEGDGERTLVTGFGEDERYPRPAEQADEPFEMHHRTSQWLIQHPQSLRKHLAATDHSERAAQVFPMLLVYDESKLEPAPGNGYSVAPKAGSSFGDALITAYVLPYAAETPKKYHM